MEIVENYLEMWKFEINLQDFGSGLAPNLKCEPSRCPCRSPSGTPRPERSGASSVFLFRSFPMVEGTNSDTSSRIRFSVFLGTALAAAAEELQREVATLEKENAGGNSDLEAFGKQV